MKPKLIAIFILLAGGYAASAQKIKDSQVPDIVKASFIRQYPEIKARWEKEGANFEAGFKKDGIPVSILYQADGTLLESETGIAESELPPSVLNYVKSNYKGKKIKESAKITKADGTLNYEAGIEGKDLIFDINGKFIKEVND